MDTSSKLKVGDRAMVAAALMPALVASHLKYSDYPIDQSVMNRYALEWADALIAEGAKAGAL